MDLCDIGMIGLAVMGTNLTLNMNDHGYRVAVWNLEQDRTDEFMKKEGAGRQIVATHTFEELVGSLKKPRRIMMMIKAGNPVDQVIQRLMPLLEPGDILIDGGNSNFKDTIRRVQLLESKGMYFIGMGVSGGEVGARYGPSLMPGGSTPAWPHVKEIFQSIAAKVDDGSPCCDWVGEGGAGHFIKMVHNGIEYGDMEIIAESYNQMKTMLGMDNNAMHDVFAGWNAGKLNSYLIEITAQILVYKDQDGKPLLDKILDEAEQKGTGRWTITTALELGAPFTLGAEAVMARDLSVLKDARLQASKALTGPTAEFHGPRPEAIEDICKGLYAAKIVSYTQGYMMMQAAAQEYKWNLNYGGIALMWRGGCIIRSIFLGRIKEAFDKNPQLSNLLLDDYFRNELNDAQAGWRRAVSAAVAHGIPTPAMSAALAFYDGFRQDRLPANLIQAQRDYFGAHTYERVDRPRGQYFHTDWAGTGGDVTAGTYQG